MCAAWVMSPPIRWLVVRANPVGNRKAFCLGMEGEGAREMEVTPKSQSSICAKRDKLTFHRCRVERGESQLQYQCQTSYA